MLPNLYYYSAVISHTTPPDTFNTLTAIDTINLCVAIIFLVHKHARARDDGITARAPASLRPDPRS